jgi:hypothetical protein
MRARSPYKHSLSLLERAFAGVDLVLGIGVLGLAAVLIVSAFLPLPAGGDKAKPLANRTLKLTKDLELFAAPPQTLI